MEPTKQPTRSAQRRAQQESEQRHRDFQAFYAERCRKLGIPVEGALSVDDIARIPSHASALK